MRSDFGRRAVGLIFLLGAVVLAAGCPAQGVKQVPVSGRVTLDNKPLPAGSVMFHPDQAKGNKSQFAPAGMIDDKGEFRLTTNGKDGAPLGWYKVTLSVSVPSSDPAAAKGVKVNPKYQNPGLTPLSVEVIEGAPPGTYDVHATK